MRLDKFLWTVRKFKTRGLATEAVKKERITVNEIVSKPSKELKVSDVIRIRQEGFLIQLKVLDFPKSRVGAKLVELYIKDETPQEEVDKQEFIKLMRNFNRDRGTGRPTKRERRDLDDFTNH